MMAKRHNHCGALFICEVGEHPEDLQFRMIRKPSLKNCSRSTFMGVLDGLIPGFGMFYVIYIHYTTSSALIQVKSRGSGIAGKRRKDGRRKKRGKETR